VLGQTHQPNLAILGVCEALCGKEERKSFKINNMRVCEVDQDIRFDVFVDVYGDLRHGLSRGRTRREASAPRIAVVSAHDLLLGRIEGAADTMSVLSLLCSRVVPKGANPPPIGAKVASSPHIEERL